MGNTIRRSFVHLTVRTDRDAFSRTECHDSDVIKKIWQVIDKDSAYYGFAFCTLLFENHPQYAKYFVEESVPVFVQEARVKKKFTVIYDIVCALFIDYQDKPVQKKHLLGYIAMVHKDMGLTLRDFENFMSDLLETLAIELPHVMSEEYTLIQMSYLKDIAGMLPKLMEEQQKRLEQIQTYRSPATKKVCRSREAVLNLWIEVLCCAWHRNPQSQMIYGLPLKFWLYKKRYWEYRRAIWRSTTEGSVEPATPTVAPNRGNMSNVCRKSSDVRKNQRRRQLKTKSRDKSVNYDSETSTEPEGN
ncbi:uncharacterized protein LOC143371451 [Andrena cerasifolii]|uniref:uncharacterized protein LOC143371451 n=1 Tax=Andrena cerasifolii TaxID=2819439 RepID=UPI0040382EF7